MVIDCYGWDSRSSHFLKDERAVADVVKSGSITYLRFTTDDVGPIHKIDESVPGTTTIRWTYGSWEQRSTLTYSYDKNTTIEV